MAESFIGERQESNELLDDLRPLAAELYALRDEIGVKKNNVYFLEIDQAKNTVWKQILPTPRLSINMRISQSEGGVINQGDLILSGFPISKFSYEDLKTSSPKGDVKKYWFIDGLVYTTVQINKMLLSWTVYIRRFESYNRDRFTIPFPLKLHKNVFLEFYKGVQIGI